MRRLALILLLLALAGALNAFVRRPIVQEPGVLVPDAPLQSDPVSRATTRLGDFELTPLADFSLDARVLSRADYRLGTESELSPTDLALGWGTLSDPRIVDQLSFPQYKSFYSRFVVPELKRGSELSQHPWPELNQMFTALTHVHTIPGDPVIRKTLAGIRPGQVIRFKATLVDAVGPSGFHYSSSLALGDHNCEVAWIDVLELE